MKRLLPFILALLLLPSLAHAAYPADAIPTDFKLWWDVPVRAYTGVKLNTRLTYYEIDNRGVVWSMTGAPSGLTLSANGTINWESPAAGTYAGIVVTITRSTCNSTDFPGCSLTASQTFTLAVGTSDFVFVDDTGTDNAGCSTLASPCATLSYAVANKISGTDGKTIYMRAGAYTDSFTGGGSGIFGAAFTAADYVEIAAYPDEAVTINAAAGAGIYLSSSANYALVRNVTVHGSTASERGNFVAQGNNVIIKDVISYGASWTGNDNLTGIQLSGSDDVVINRAVSYSTSTGIGNQFNVSNFLSYNNTAGTRWLINSKAYSGNINYKIKHTNADNSRTIFHNLEGHSTGAAYYNFSGFGKNSSLRYAVFYNGSANIVNLGQTDPSAYTTQGMLIEHVTLTGASTANSNVWIDNSYGNVGTVTLRRNLFFQNNGACVAGNPDSSNRKVMLVAWYYTAQATADDYPISSNYNIWYNSAGDTDCFHLGNTGAPAPTNLAGWRAFSGSTRDPNSSLLDPGLNNVATGDLTITSADNAATQCGSGEYCGAFKPDKSYGTVGASNTTLLDWGVDDSIAGTNTTSGITAIRKFFRGGR